MTQDSETCPKCNTGKLRPTGKSGIANEETEPIRETGGTKEYSCDNSECGMKFTDVGLKEYIPLSDSVSAKVIKAADDDKEES